MNMILTFTSKPYSAETDNCDFEEYKAMIESQENKG